MKKLSDEVLHRLGRLVVRENAPLGLVIDDRYEISGRLGRGGMGEIFTARDHRLGRVVAMKILASRLAAPEWAARFEDEARTMDRIGHPGIVPIHDLGVLPDGRLYYTMKLVKGQTLEELVAERGDRRRLLGLLARTAEIVQHAHERGVVHRDLKPSNIMVGEGDQPYVLDWGIARVVQEAEAAGGDGSFSHSGFTSVGSVLGTLSYMPPEQARGDLAAIDARSDVYALGAILYEILTGRPPAVGTTATEVLERVVSGDYPLPRDIEPTVPADLEAIALKALQGHQRRRYPSSKAFGRDLQSWLDGDPVSAHPQTLGYRLSKLWGRRRTLLLLSAAAVAALVSLTGYLFLTWEDRSLAETKRNEDMVLGPLRKRVEILPRTREGSKRGLQLVDQALREVPGSWDAWMMKGEFHERLGDHSPAVAAYREAAQRNPRLAAAHYRAGRILMDMMSDNAAAMEAFEKALKAEPENEYALVGQARGAALRKDYDEALRLCERAAPFGAHHWDLPFIRGMCRVLGPPGKIRDLRKAAEEFERSIELAPDRAVTHSNLGHVLHLLKDGPGAERHHSRAVELDPKFAAAYSNRSVTRFDRGDVEGALADAETAVLLNPRYAPGYTNRSRARAKKEDHEGSLVDALRAAELDPEDAMAQYNLGTCRQREGKPREALALYTRALDLDPALSEAFVNRGLVRHDLEDLEGAVRDFDRAIALAPEDSEAYNDRGLSRTALKDLEGALADYAKAIAVDPRNASAYGNRSVVHRLRGDLAAAMADLSKAIEVDPKLPGAYVNRGVVRLDLKDPKGALEDYSRAIELDPGFVAAYANRGGLRQSAGDLEGALADLTKAIALEPRHATAYYDRGNVRLDRNEFEAAVADYDRAIEIDPRHSGAYSNRGTAKLRKGDARGAVADCTRAIELDPSQVAAYVNRGLARQAQGDRTGAALDLQKALDVAPPNWEFRVKVEAALRQLGR